MPKDQERTPQEEIKVLEDDIGVEKKKIAALEEIGKKARQKKPLLGPYTNAIDWLIDGLINNCYQQITAYEASIEFQQDEIAEQTEKQ